MKKKDSKIQVENHERLDRMPVPEKVRIGFADYQIVMVESQKEGHKTFSPLDGAVYYGETIYQDQVIMIAEGLPAQQEANTVLHEIMHVCFANFGNGGVNASAWTEENYVIAGTNGLCQVFQQNPSLVLYLAVNLGVEGFEAYMPGKISATVN